MSFIVNKFFLVPIRNILVNIKCGDKILSNFDLELEKIQNFIPQNDLE